MTKEQQRIKNHFAENLKAEEYLHAMGKLWKGAPELLRFMMMFLNDKLRSGKFKGSKLLDIGSGATVHNIATASAYFSNITMIDYVEDNVENLKQWIQGNSNLAQFLEIPAGLEGFGDNIEGGVKILQSRIRKNVKRVARCDVLVDSILLDADSNLETSPPYDLIISCLCLETAPEDFKGYIDIIKRINKLLRPGGGLLLCGFLGGQKWAIADKEFHHIQIQEEELEEALTKAEFKIIDIKTLGKEGLTVNYEFDKLFCCAAEKL